MSAFVPSPDEQNRVPVSPAVPAVEVFPEIIVATGETIGTMDEVGVAVESRLARLKRIGKPIASFFSVQIVVQILTMLSGLLLVRHMSKTEYAFYTVANSMQGTIAVLGDSGINSALSAIGGVVWQDRRRFGELIQTALEFRRKFGIATFIVIGPLMWWLLYSNGSGTGYATLLSIIVLSGASLSLIHGILIVVPRLHARVSQLQKAELVLSILRLVLIGAACLVFINAAVAVAIFLVTLALQNVLYRRWANVDADLSAPTNEEDRKEIWKMVRYQGPISIFYCLQGQIFILLIGFLGNTTDIANLGALSRLTLFFSIISSLTTNIILPRFSRCHDKHKLKVMYLQIYGFYIVLSCAFMVVVLLFPGPILWLLGGGYANLRSELAYMTFSTVAGATSGILYSLNAAKGWLKGAWISIPIILVTQALMLPFLDLGTIKSVALLGAIPTLLGGMPYLFQAYNAIRSIEGQAQS